MPIMLQSCCTDLPLSAGMPTDAGAQPGQELLLPHLLPEALFRPWKTGLSAGGRTRTRTWDPLIKSPDAVEVARLPSPTVLSTSGAKQARVGFDPLIPLAHRGAQSHAW